MSTPRPAASVVVPFLGDPAAAARTLDALAALELGTDDELIVADNTPAGVVPDDGRARVVRAPERRSAYHARNAGAAWASTPWLLFTDADCLPSPDLLDRLLAPEPASDCAIVAGEVTGDVAQAQQLARWARSRRALIASHHLDGGPGPAGVTANLLVRRAAFEAAAGFAAEVRSDADIDLCWRLQRDGWKLDYRPQALVVHRDPERLGAVLGQAAGYGAGRRWLRRRWGDSVPPAPLLRPVARALAGALVWTLTLRFERACFKLVDGVSAAAMWWGYRFGSNVAGA